MSDKIRFGDLSIVLKIAIIFSYIIGVLWVIPFLVGLIASIIGL